MGSLIGVWKVAAQRVGLHEREYLGRVDAGERWCWRCRAWHPVAAFARDRARPDGLTRDCRESRNRVARDVYKRRVLVHRRPRL